MINSRVAALVNFIAPYRVSFWQELTGQLDSLKIFISTPMEPNRQWPVDWQDLNVSIQKNITFHRIWKHPGGFQETIYVHIPYDTLGSLTTYGPDIIISSELGLRSFQAALYCRIHPRCRLILWCTLSEHTEHGRGWIREKLRRWLLPRADAVLVNGESGARYIRRFDIPDISVFQIGQAPQIEDFTVFPINHPLHYPIHLLFVGSLIERKGLLPFINILKSWCRAHPNAQIELHFVGDGPLYEAIANQQYPPNVEIHMLGSVSYKDVPRVYANADILVFPTLADEWGLVVNEALASGLPVLGSLYSQAVEELVQSGVNGWTFFPDQPESMDRAVNQALSTDPSHLAEMRIAARKSALSITPRTMTEKMVKSLEFVLGNRNLSV